MRVNCHSQAKMKKCYKKESVNRQIKKQRERGEGEGRKGGDRDTK